MMQLLCILMVTSACIPAYGWFEHGRAIDAANKGDWQRANTLLTTELINHSDDQLVVYDAGVAAYKIADYEHARAYFNHVKDFPHAAYNLGNTYVALKNLEEAITSYEHALRIDPQDERARHNLEIVKKMLEEQKKQDNKDDKSEQQQENKQDKSEQSEQSQESDDESESDEKQSGGDESESKNESNSKNKQDEQKDKKQDAGTNAQQEAQQKKQEQQSAAASGEQDKKTEQQKKDAYGAFDKKLDKQLVYLLEQQEKQDAQVNKQMIKATVGSQSGGKHDKQSW